MLPVFRPNPIDAAHGRTTPAKAAFDKIRRNERRSLSPQKKTDPRLLPGFAGFRTLQSWVVVERFGLLELDLAKMRVLGIQKPVVLGRS
jgi:hypothetical protein